jgi:hypothetical protein
MDARRVSYFGSKSLFIHNPDYPEYYLKPGYRYVTQAPTCIVTVSLLMSERDLDRKYFKEDLALPL